MVQTNEIKAQMKRYGITQRELAEKLNINVATLNRKINDESGKTMTVEETNRIAEVLQLSSLDCMRIFFA